MSTATKIASGIHIATDIIAIGALGLYFVSSYDLTSKKTTKENMTTYRYTKPQYAFMMKREVAHVEPRS